MSEKENSYQESLDSKSSEIRLLTLYPGASDSHICCTLKKANLSERPPYRALSYVWGDTKVTRMITVNSSDVAVTANLATVLQHLRHLTDELTLWIDALCINQQNLEERNAQVQLMGEIYSIASRVLLWIGEADANSDAAFDCMPLITSGIINDQARTKAVAFYLSVGDRHWFQRCWILQELALATEDPTVVCGMKHAPWSVFMSAWRVLALEVFSEIGMARKVTEEPDLKHAPLEIVAKLKIDVLDGLRREVHEEGGLDFRKLLLISRTSEATNAKDRIYALLGMLKHSDRTAYFAVDYSKPISTIYAQAMAHIFTKGLGPFFLSGMWLPGLTPLVSDLPSWVPDFSSQTAAAGVCGIGFHPAHPLSVSGAGAGAHNGAVIDDVRTLRVEALRVDVIDHVTLLSSDFDSCLVQLPGIVSRAALARTKTIEDDRLRPYFENFRSSEPFWRTMISNKQFNSGYDVAPDAYGRMYNELLENMAGVTATANDSPRIGVSSAYVDCLRQNLPGRAFFTTRNGFVGLAVPDVCPQDEVTIWFGATIPFITRQDPDREGHCQLVGGAYVGGIMQGEIVDELYCEDLMDSHTLLVL